VNVLVTLNSLILGGCQLNAVDMAAAAERHGVRSVLVGFRVTMPESGPSMVDAAHERGVQLMILDTPMETTSAAPALARIADDYDADIVHAYGGWDLRAAFQGPCRWGRRPLVQTVYEMYVSSQTYPHQPLIVGTGYLLDEQREIRPGPVHLISPPVDLVADAPGYDPTEFLRAFKLDPSRPHVVIVSRLSEDMKELGIRQTIEAMELVDRDVGLIIVGTGDAEYRLRCAGDHVNENLGRRVVMFCGPMHDPRGAYAAADIVVGMGSSAARALAFGKPLIVGGERGWYRTFTRDTARLLFRNSFWSDESEPDAVERLARDIRTLADDPDARQALGEFGREFAEENFGLEAMTERLVDVYRRALADHRRVSWFQDLPTEVRPLASWVKRKWVDGFHYRRR
jgi:glycosyltransferase involved in cell wall biosynthesis